MGLCGVHLFWYEVGFCMGLWVAAYVAYIDDKLNLRLLARVELISFLQVTLDEFIDGILRCKGSMVLSVGLSGLMLLTVVSPMVMVMAMMMV